MEKDAAGYPQGHTKPGISRYLASRLPYVQSGSRGADGKGRSRLPVTADAYGLTNPGIRRNLASRLPYEEETRTLKPFAETLRVQSRLAKLDQQPEASLAWWWGNPSCEA